ncbi:MAG: DUF819 family protein [Cyclobacteriaceae bacterium]
MVTDIAFVLFLISFPLLIIWLEEKVTWIKWIGPVIICYAAGIFLAQLPIFNADTGTVMVIAEITVPLAIPLLLFSTDFIRWITGARKAVVSFFLCVLSVAISSGIGAFIFQDNLPDIWKLAGMLVGVYTGGTPNLTAIGLSLEVGEEMFVLINTADLIMGSVYLIFLMTIAKKVLGRILPSYVLPEKKNGEPEYENIFPQLPLRVKVRQLIIYFFSSVAILAIAVGISYLFLNTIQPALIILVVTTLGIAVSFSKKNRQTKGGNYELGEYLLLVFCLALGSMVNLADLASSASYSLYFTGFVMFGSILLHFAMAYFVKIDRDTTIITSIAGVFGPAFVGPMAKVLNNKNTVLTGITAGLVGYALGNYLGIGFALLMKIWLG